MTAVTSDLYDVLFGRVSAVITAIVIITAYSATTSAVRAPVVFIICHIIFSLCSNILLTAGNYIALGRRQITAASQYCNYM
jgi:hypothetical protein